MPIESTTINTFTCSIVDCEMTKNIAGTLEQAFDEAKSLGWALEEAIFNKVYDFCPEHAKELKLWLSGDDFKDNE